MSKITQKFENHLTAIFADRHKNSGPIGQELLGTKNLTYMVVVRGGCMGHFYCDRLDG